MALNNQLVFDSFYLEFGLNRVLQDVYMECSQGEVVGLLGRNGSGKSCLMQIVFGSRKAYQQSVRINGAYLLNSNIRKGLIHYLPQESFIPKSFTVKMALSHYQIPIDELLVAFPHFTNLMNLKIAELAGGDIRLLEIMLILKQKGLFCILDEPFSNLMPLHIEKIMELITASKLDKGIIVTDHLYPYLLKVSNRLYVLQNGKTYSVKNPEELITFGYLPQRPNH
jgi:ABC-type lipopolysaccharide export system ATPase subunit